MGFCWWARFKLLVIDKVCVPLLHPLGYHDTMVAHEHHSWVQMLLSSFGSLHDTFWYHESYSSGKSDSYQLKVRVFWAPCLRSVLYLTIGTSFLPLGVSWGQQPEAAWFGITLHSPDQKLNRGLSYLILTSKFLTWVLDVWNKSSCLHTKQFSKC